LLDCSSELLGQLRLGDQYLDRLFSQLSGGEKQHIAIARAFAAQPELVLCDEITSALGVPVQAAVLELLDDLRRVNETSYIFVNHDLAVVKALLNHVAVFYEERLYELGPTQDVYVLVTYLYTEVFLGKVLEPNPDFMPSLAASDVVELSPQSRASRFSAAVRNAWDPFLKIQHHHAGNLQEGIPPGVIAKISLAEK